MSLEQRLQRLEVQVHGGVGPIPFAAYIVAATRVAAAEAAGGAPAPADSALVARVYAENPTLAAAALEAPEGGGGRS